MGNSEWNTALEAAAKVCDMHADICGMTAGARKKAKAGYEREMRAAINLAANIRSMQEREVGKS